MIKCLRCSTLAIIFVVLFGLTTGLHLFQCSRKRSWFMTPFVIGGLFETIGYVGRILSANDRLALPRYIMQSLLLLLGPSFYAATIYMIFGRLLSLTEGERYSIVSRTCQTKVFISGDVISFLMQGAGGGIMSSGVSGMSTGEKVIIGGLIVQILSFGLFFITVTLFRIRGREQLERIGSSVAWRRHFLAIYATSSSILVRSTFRVVEYVQGNRGYLMKHEVFLYLFDALIMFSVMIILNVIHPGDMALLLRGRQKELS